MHGRVLLGLGLVEVELLVKNVSCLVAVLALHPTAGEVKSLGELDIGLHLFDHPRDLLFGAEDRPVVATGVDVLAPEVVPALILVRLRRLFDNFDYCGWVLFLDSFLLCSWFVSSLRVERRIQ